ncbi:DNA-directed RNA polymerase III subunit RPC4 [Clupea harengus]|uniref:DNA-directed RNA polymerase III subunit RPC4 n=1 Tax=Clupea harengus TaxID=7950 RepID=A0A6P8FR11_CLUHA|nr:DNA-directed RNA polymerase III subunit RPC4 [Clupea harengus]
MAAPNAGDSKTQTVDGAGRGAPRGRRLPASLSPGRLPSMRSRDLTLGGVKKKTFTPNIIGRKVKEEQKADGGQRRDKKDYDKGRQRDGRGRGRGRPEVIQSHSIFEQGPAELMAKRRTAAGFDDARETPNSGPSPIINIKKEKRETEEETKEILRKLEKDNFLDDPHLKNDAKSCPVQLPLAVSGWVFKEEFREDSDEDDKHESTEEHSGNPSTETSPLINIKQEPDLIEVKKQEPSYRPPPLPQPDVLSKLLESWNQPKGVELFFMQLPDSLPGQPPTTDVRQTKTEVPSECGQAVLQKTETPEAEEDGSCNLRDLQEGLVGRVLVRKSGRVQFVLGNVTLDVDLGTSSSFLQELVSVGIEGRSGTMSVLGHIKHKLVCSPDFQALLENKA